MSRSTVGLGGDGKLGKVTYLVVITLAIYSLFYFLHVYIHCTLNVVIALCIIVAPAFIPTVSLLIQHVLHLLYGDHCWTLST